MTLSIPLGIAQEALIFMRRRALRCPDFPPLLVFRLKEANAPALFLNNESAQPRAKVKLYLGLNVG